MESGSVWVFVSLIALVSGGSESCSAAASCLCMLGSEGELDLKPQDVAQPSQVYSAQTFNADLKATEWSLDTYYFHPCRDIPLGDQSLANNHCPKASLCKHTLQFKKNSTIITMEDLGNSLLGSFADSKMIGSKNKVVLNYKKDTIETTIVLNCITDGDSFLQITSGDPKAPILAFYSPNACIKNVSEPSRHSLGTTLLIVFFVLSLVYLITGYVVKRLSTGARGIELIPNINFWKDLPLLVKDGVVYVQNGFKPPMSTASPPQNSNPNSYDSI